MKQFILATAVALTSLASAAQVQLPADIEASLGQAKMSGGVRIEGMDIQALRDSLKSVRTKAVFHLDANNQIELTPSSSARDRAATKPGEFVGSGGGTMDEDVIDLVQEPLPRTRVQFVGVEGITSKLPACTQTTKDNCHVASVRFIGSDRFSAHRNIGSLGDVYTHGETGIASSEKGVSVVVNVVMGGVTRQVLHGVHVLTQGELNIIPLREVNIRRNTALLFSTSYAPFKVWKREGITMKGNIWVDNYVAYEYDAKWNFVNTKFEDFSSNPESVETLFMTPGTYKVQGTSERGPFERILEIK